MIKYPSCSLLRWIGLHLVAPLVGGVVALGLRGEWNLLLSAAFIISIGIASLILVVFASDPLLQFLLALGFYAVAFQGMLGPLDGAFGGIWFILTIVFSFFQSGRVAISSIFVGRQTFRILLLPFAVVSFECARCQVTKLYDGAGLTLCLLGQASASDDYLLQSADLGGVWLLSYYCTLLGAPVAAWFSPALTMQFRRNYKLFALSAFGSAYAYGGFRLTRIHEGAFTEKMLVYVVPNRPELDQTSSIFQSISHRDGETKSHETLVVYPETSISWHTNPVTQEQLAILRLTKLQGVTVVFGAWFASDSGRRRNVSTVAKNGKVVAIVDKQHRAPFVESRPFSTSALVSAGLIPRAAVRDVEEAEPLDLAAWNKGAVKIAPGVCYDIFLVNRFIDFQPIASA